MKIEVLEALLSGERMERCPKPRAPYCERWQPFQATTLTTIGTLDLGNYVYRIAAFDPRYDDPKTLRQALEVLRVLRDWDGDGTAEVCLGPNRAALCADILEQAVAFMESRA